MDSPILEPEHPEKEQKMSPRRQILTLVLLGVSTFIFATATMMQAIRLDALFPSARPYLTTTRFVPINSLAPFRSFFCTGNVHYKDSRPVNLPLVPIANLVTICLGRHIAHCVSTLPTIQRMAMTKKKSCNSRLLSFLPYGLLLLICAHF